jgi:hypothetical protein
MLLLIDLVRQHPKMSGYGCGRGGTADDGLLHGQVVPKMTFGCGRLRLFGQRSRPLDHVASLSQGLLNLFGKVLVLDVTHG